MLFDQHMGPLDQTRCGLVNWSESDFPPPEAPIEAALSLSIAYASNRARKAGK